MSEKFLPSDNEPEKNTPPRFEGIWTEGFEHIKRIEGKRGTLAFGTDIGIKRKRNEDALVVDLTRDKFAIIDGMGGMGKGDLAAKILAEEILKGFQDGAPADEVQHNAHERMKEMGVGEGGACYASLTLKNKEALINYAGDVELIIANAQGEITFRNEGEGHGNRVYNAVQGTSSGTTRTEIAWPHNGDRIYFASDGLWHNIDIEEAIRNTINLPIDEAVQTLVAAAKERMTSDEIEKYPDNITVLLYDLRTLGNPKE